uniref:Phospholipase A2-like central domain-containing protein n=1 Tax=Erpetoichthys calabaricus TaxID=27687 RepID=A0A8C4THG2_ERPCA
GAHIDRIILDTDKCCREHDHCRHTISAFSLKYGVFNRHLFTVSHCQCDRRFRNCLLGVNDTVSNLVGYGFFNVLKVPCFVFESRMQCTQAAKQERSPVASKSNSDWLVTTGMTLFTS